MEIRQHTPGPWIREGSHVFVKGDNDTIVFCCDTYSLPAESAANVCLIAAAPELLKALQDILPGAEAYANTLTGDYFTMWDNQLKKAKAAIAKATGAACCARNT